jgi:hypothetical protein
MLCVAEDGRFRDQPEDIAKYQAELNKIGAAESLAIVLIY